MIGPLRTRRDDLRRASKVARSVTRHGPPGAIAESRGSRRQPVSALPSPGPDDGSAGACRHTVTKPMILGPLAVVGLERALHPRLLCAQPRRPGRVGRAGRWSARLRHARQHTDRISVQHSASGRTSPPSSRRDGSRERPVADNGPGQPPLSPRPSAPTSRDATRLPVLRCFLRRDRTAMSGWLSFPRAQRTHWRSGSTGGGEIPTRLIHSCGSPCGEWVTGRRRSW